MQCLIFTYIRDITPQPNYINFLYLQIYIYSRQNHLQDIQEVHELLPLLTKPLLSTNYNTGSTCLWNTTIIMGTEKQEVRLHQICKKKTLHHHKRLLHNTTTTTLPRFNHPYLPIRKNQTDNKTHLYKRTIHLPTPKITSTQQLREHMQI